MADVFISYAHEDQAFARRMVPALEAEGFSVWWDHTIPPGQSWDTFIARGIEEARCCIVLWSGRSVGSDWVKEEATLAKDAGKLIPVQIDAEAPPVGFRRIQAAQLLNWNGDTRNPQWQLLVGEVRRIVSASRAGGAPAQRPVQDFVASPAPPSPKKSPPWAVLGAVGVIAVIGLLAFLLLSRPQPTREAEVATETATTTAVQSTTAPADNSAELERLRRESDESQRQSQSEIERLRRERDAAVASEREARAAGSTQLSLPPAQRMESAIQASSLVGTWTFSRSQYSNGGGPWSGSRTLRADGTFVDSDGTTGTWQLTGASLSMQLGGVRYSGVISGGRISGQATGTTGATATFTMTR